MMGGQRDGGRNFSCKLEEPDDKLRRSCVEWHANISFCRKIKFIECLREYEKNNGKLMKKELQQQIRGGGNPERHRNN